MVPINAGQFSGYINITVAEYKTKLAAKIVELISSKTYSNRVKIYFKISQGYNVILLWDNPESIVSAGSDLSVEVSCINGNNAHIQFRYYTTSEPKNVLLQGGVIK